jgi:adenine specific DNA methylase Mod
LNQLFFGDNLGVLRESIKDESVDLIYLDPPFNSSANYNVLFSSPKGHQSGAQIEAFEDTWHWGEEAEKEYAEILSQPNTQLADVVRSFRQFLGENDMMAYLVMMANRLLELHRVLKETGSLYLHCDPTASHYLKLVLDGIFGADQFRNEIVWKRTTAHNDPVRYGRISDRILYYTKTDKRTFNVMHGDYSAEQLSRYKYEDEKGKFKAENLTAPHFSETRTIDWRGVHPGSNRQWRFSTEELDRLYEEGRILLQRNGLPRKDGLKEYLHEALGAPLQDIWMDIQMAPTTGERLGYPTQKPLALLDRIIASSSNVGDVVLDPFCGCGTAVHSSQKLNRNWIGIDITHLAISLIEKRLRDAFPKIEFEVHGTPKDYEGAKNLAERDKYQFQWWACSLVNAQPYGGKKKGADGGVDGIIFFQDEIGTPSRKIIVSVKGGENVGVTMVEDLIATIQRQKAEIGLFVTLNAPTKPMIAEAAAAGFYKSPAGGVFPKIQILEIEKLIEHHDEARYPHLDAGSLTFKKAEIEHGEDKQVDLFAAPIKGSKKKK